MKEQFINAFERFFDRVVDQSPDIVVGILLFAALTFMGQTLRRLTKKRLARRVEDPLLVNFIGRIIFLVFLIIGIVFFLNQVGLGKAAGGLLAGAGVSAIILGFAFKDIGENFLAGFFLAFSRPFSIGDVIELEGLKGVVKALNFRNTHIRTFDGKDIFIPNAMLIKNPLQNFTRDGLLRYRFVVGIDYGDDIRKAIKTIVDTLNKDSHIEKEGDVEPFIQLEEFATSTVNLGVYYWVNSKNFTGHIASLTTGVMHAVVQKLIAEGFNLPADIVELKIYQEDEPILLAVTDKSS